MLPPIMLSMALKVQSIDAYILQSPGKSVIHPPLYLEIVYLRYLTSLYCMWCPVSFQTIRIYPPFLAGVDDGGDIKDAHPSSIPKPKPIIICGDLNVAATSLDLKNPKANIHNAGFTEEEREKFSRLLASGYIDTYRAMHPDKQEFSWWSYRFRARERNAGWRIDYFLVSEQAKDIVTNASIDTAITGSDHAPVLLSINI